MASQSYLRHRSNTNTEENEFKTALVNDPPSLDTASESDDSDLESKHTSMKKHARKRVITNEKQRKRQKFKTFVRPNEINPKHLSAKEKMSPSFMRKSWRGKKKLVFQGMEAFIHKPRSHSSSEQSIKPTDTLQEDALALLDSLEKESPATTQTSKGLERETNYSENLGNTLLEHTCSAKFNNTETLYHDKCVVGKSLQPAAEQV